MTETLKQIIKNKDMIVPRLLFFNYKKIGITEKELILIIYIINTTNIFNPKQISNDLKISLNEVMETISNMKTKGLLNIELKKVGTKRVEYIELDNLYEKLTFNILNEEPEEDKTNIYDIFEKEFGRTISPMEYEIIGAWIENGTSEETIILALKEATYNGVSNLRYIDKIISEWAKKGIKTQEDVEKSRINFKQKKEKKTKNDILDYDWLNDK